MLNHSTWLFIVLSKTDVGHLIDRPKTDLIAVCQKKKRLKQNTMHNDLAIFMDGANIAPIHEGLILQGKILLYFT